MTRKTFDIVLRKRSETIWTTDALGLPTARILEVNDQRDVSVPFERVDGGLKIGKRAAGPLVGRLEVIEELTTLSALETMKLDLEREKVASEERHAKRTLLVSIVTAVISAGAAIGVAAIANPSKPDRPVGASYKDINECREELNRLTTLAALDQQTLDTLRIAVRSHIDRCKERLKSAMDASPS